MTVTIGYLEKEEMSIISNKEDVQNNVLTQVAFALYKEYNGYRIQKFIYGAIICTQQQIRRC